MNKALFLDRDGTINVDKGYTHKIEDLQFVEGMPEFIRSYNEKGYLVLVITNQAGVARGYYTEEDVQTFHEYMNEQLALYGAHIDAFYYCPHHPTEGVGIYKADCDCRKPKGGLFEKAIKEWNINAKESILVGDKESDVEAGCGVGIRICRLVGQL